MNQGPSWLTPAGFLFTATENIAVSAQIVASGTNVTYSQISGSLPTGLSVSTTGTITGVPGAVLNLTRDSFVIRAKSATGVSDRTFIIDVTGVTTPTWNTSPVTVSSGTTYLNIGPTGESWALNNQYVNYTLSASAASELTPLGTNFRYYVVEGTLPPGLTLDQNGTISGFLKDTLAVDGASVPKVYNFTTTVTDGIASSSTQFSILVVDPEIVKDPSLFLDNLDPGILTTNTNYLPPLQFINGTDLGIIRAENEQYLNVSAYNPYPETGVEFYYLVTGTTVTTQLPPDLKLDLLKGLIYGYVPYQPAFTKDYTLTIGAGRAISTTSIVTSTNTFTLAVKGAVDSSIEWVSGSTLGSIELGETSELSVKATQVNGNYEIAYQQLTGELPTGLTLSRDGTISGIVDYDANTGTYTISVQASDVYDLSAIEKTFTLDVTKYNDKKYTKIYCRPFFTKDKRKIYQDFITDGVIFDQSLIYRPFDPNFGVQSDIKLNLEFGIEQLNLGDIVLALQENFYRRRIYLGDIKTAIAKDSTGTVIYEIVYVDAVDDLVNSQGVSVSPVVYINDEIYYPGSIDNQRLKLSQLTLPDLTPIDINEYMLPSYMRTVQSGDYKIPGYMRVIPLCYALPGQGQKIISRIKQSGFDLTQFDFEIDRIVVQDSLDNNSAKYLLLGRQAMGDLIDRDSYLIYPPDFELPFDASTNIRRE